MSLAGTNMPTINQLAFFIPEPEPTISSPSSGCFHGVREEVLPIFSILWGFHSSKCVKGLQLHPLLFDGLYFLFNAPYLEKFRIFRKSEYELNFFDLYIVLRCIELIN